MDEAPEPAELLILKIIDAMPSRGNSYHLERFFAKTDLWGFKWAVIAKQMAAKGWLTHELRHPLNYYQANDLTTQILHKHYNTDAIAGYVMQMEPGGFVLGLLRKIDEWEKG